MEVLLTGDRVTPAVSHACAYLENSLGHDSSTTDLALYDGAERTQRIMARGIPWGL